MANPEKSEIEKIFNRLRSIPTNKTCFDCAAKNPTWASVTYGVFICIDCSAVHRSLGVHLTFVRSTNLDTNWTWIQLRQMQLGGNANGAQFFRQHNCVTTDAQQKYNSRAAQLYRDKLQNQAQQAMRLHGTSLHLDSVQPEVDTSTKKEEDFFSDCNSIYDNNTNNNLINGTNLASSQQQQFEELEEVPKLPSQKADDLNETGAPSVDFLNSTMPIEPIKSTIGVRKIQPKKGGMGGKKMGGLGATRVKTNFADLEQRATMADQLKEAVPEKKLTEEEEADAIASVRLAYQDLSMKQHKEEERLKSVDPTKAKQMERLGMGFNFKSGGVSHSALTDMQTINQEQGPKVTMKSFEREREPVTPVTTNDFFDDYSTSMYSSVLKNDRELAMMGFETIEPIEPRQKNIQTMFSSGGNGSSSNNNINNNNNNKQHGKLGSISDQPSYSRNSRNTNNLVSNSSSSNNDDVAQKKFGGAKAISSDQYFNTEPSQFERAANMNRFQGSNSISSADYFSDGTPNSANSMRNNASSNRSFDMQYNVPDMDEFKDSVRQGVTKVAGKLSNMANNVMTSLQDKYGY